MTLLELLLASSIMALFAATISALAVAVQQNNQYNDGMAALTQHARVAIQRIERSVRKATASERFPGCVAVARRSRLRALPNALVVWRGDIPPADPEGVPRARELVIYCPDPESPKRLLEITVPDDNRSAPPATDAWGWRQFLESLIRSERAEKTVLTDRLWAPAIGPNGHAYGAVGFNVIYRPSQDEWRQYQVGGIPWDELPWAQGIHSSQTGLRQVWCSIELPLEADAEAEDTSGAVIPFLGSAARYYALHR